MFDIGAHQPLLAQAYSSPWTIADRWHEDGKRVVGVYGHYAPPELVAAAGLLPIRLSARRLVRPEPTSAGNEVAVQAIRAGFEGELGGDALRVLVAALAGELDWVDGLLIGRDTDSHTKLFYILREFAQDAEYGSRIPPVAFCDLLRLPNRTSAVYNRARLSELAGLLGQWGDRDVSGDDLKTAYAGQAEVRRQLLTLNGLRRARLVSGRDMFVAAAAAAVLPSDACIRELAQMTTACQSQVPLETEFTAFLTGSEIDTAELYAAFESSGIRIVGEDHTRGIEPEPEHPASDPISALADRYQFSPLGAARAGLDRLAHTVQAARDARVDAVVQILVDDDAASAWETAELRALFPHLPVVTTGVDLNGGSDRFRAAANEVRAVIAENAVAATDLAGGHG